MRIGVMVGPERGRYRTKVDRLRADARWADEAGLATVWVPQIPDDFDVLTAAAIVGSETSRIEVGTAGPIAERLGKLVGDVEHEEPGVVGLPDDLLDPKRVVAVFPPDVVVVTIDAGGRDVTHALMASERRSPIARTMPSA